DYIDRLYTDLLNVETGQRGYVITENADFLDSYERGSARLNEDITRLRAVTADNVTQQQRLDELQPLIAARVGVCKEIVALEKSGQHEAAIQHIKQGDGKRAMDQIREVLPRMRNTEDVLLNERANQSTTSARNAILTIIIGVSLASLILATTGFLTVRNIA